MATWIQFLLCFNIALCLLSVGAIDDQEQHLPIVQVINSLPPNSQTLQVSCDTENIDLGEHTLSVGQVYEWKVEKKSIYYCAAQWKLYFASWHAFELPRDENREMVYWAVRKDGFYLSWDKTKWVRNSTWETE
ncbi:unnamed protein product [Dovyalis caffra]|uniref:Plant self-incompatibility S1 n=1 Tax=Dovyalis caffra TaxID=77055 RepID=A0AAV1S5V0_9ROSI|nr:unnamed protein product [Dovyalis caffra]